MPQDFVPLYQRVIDAITEDIRAGKLTPGERLPSTDQLHKAYGVSLGTVRKAVEILIDRGVLRGHQGLGVFVSEKQGKK